jgi:peroxiredoxin Q/BCP
MLTEGDTAPEFESVDQTGKLVRLSDLVGNKNIVLYFYPWDDTPGCTKEACAFRDDMAVLADLDAEVIGVSTNDAASHRAFALKYKLPFPLLPDSEKRIGNLYGVPVRADEVHGDVYKRVTFLIDKKGKIVKAYTTVDVSVHSHEIRQLLGSLK